MADKRDILINLLGKETVSPAAKKAADGVEKLGDQMGATADDAARLDREIELAEKSLRDLAVQYARTGDAAERLDLTKAMRKQQTELRKLTKSRGFLPDFTEAGGEAASGFGASFVARVGPILARAPLGPYGVAIGVGLGAAAAPALGAAISGAVIGGVGIGGVIGGIKIASKDTRVKQAGKDLAEAVTADLERSGAKFVGPTIRSIGVIRRAWVDVSDEVDKTLAASARYVEPLAQGLARTVKEIAPGIRKVAEAAGPVIREIADGLPRLGRAISDVLSDMSENADEGASALRGLFMFTEGAIRGIGFVVNGLADMYRGLIMVSDASGAVLDKWVGWVPILGPQIDGTRGRLDELKGALEGSGRAGLIAGDAIVDGIQKADPATAALADRQKILNASMRDGISAAGGLSAAFDRLNGAALSSREAEANYQAAIDEVTASIKENGRTLDLNTAKGRANDQQIRNLIATIDQKAQATYDDTLATKGQAAAEQAAKGVYEQGRQQLIKNLTQILGNAGAARKLADQIMKIPTSWGTKVTLSDMATAKAKAIRNEISKIHGKTVTIAIKYETHGKNQGEHIIGQGTVPKYSAGGPVGGPGAKGVDSRLAMLAPGEHVLTAAEVDAAGGHTAVERLRAAIRGDAPARGAGPSSAGARRQASTGGGGGMPLFQINAGNASGLERVFVAWLVGAIRDAGGNPNVLGLGGSW